MTLLLSQIEIEFVLLRGAVKHAHWEIGEVIFKAYLAPYFLEFDYFWVSFQGKKKKNPNTHR